MPEALKHTPAVQRVLNGYLSELARHPDSGAVIRPDWDWEEDEVETDTSTLIGLTAKDHEQLLAEPVPLFFDVMLFRDKLLALGPAMPELDLLIGRPQLELREVDKKGDSPAKTIKVSHYEENFNPRLRHGSKMIYSHALKYLIVPATAARGLGQSGKTGNCALITTINIKARKVRAGSVRLLLCKDLGSALSWGRNRQTPTPTRMMKTLQPNSL